VNCPDCSSRIPFPAGSAPSMIIFLPFFIILRISAVVLFCSSTGTPPFLICFFFWTVCFLKIPGRFVISNCCFLDFPDQGFLSPRGKRYVPTMVTSLACGFLPPTLKGSIKSRVIFPTCSLLPFFSKSFFLFLTFHLLLPARSYYVALYSM